MTNENMTLWDSVCKTDPKHVKNVPGKGRKMSAIDAYYRIQRATEQWGEMGVKWGVTAPRWEIIEVGDEDRTSLLVFQGYLYSPGNRGGEAGPLLPLVEAVKFSYMGGNPKRRIVDDDAWKKVFTGALTKGLSYKGFGVDVFFGLFEDDKYVSQRETEQYQADQQEDLDRALADIEAAESKGPEALKAIEKRIRNSPDWLKDALRGPYMEARKRAMAKSGGAS